MLTLQSGSRLTGHEHALHGSLQRGQALSRVDSAHAQLGKARQKRPALCGHA